MPQKLRTLENRWLGSSRVAAVGAIRDSLFLRRFRCTLSSSSLLSFLFLSLHTGATAAHRCDAMVGGGIGIQSAFGGCNHAPLHTPLPERNLPAAAGRAKSYILARLISPGCYYFKLPPTTSHQEAGDWECAGWFDRNTDKYGMLVVLSYICFWERFG